MRVGSVYALFCFFFSRFPSLFFWSSRSGSVPLFLGSSFHRGGNKKLIKAWCMSTTAMPAWLFTVLCTALLSHDAYYHSTSQVKILKVEINFLCHKIFDIVFWMLIGELFIIISFLSFVSLLWWDCNITDSWQLLNICCLAFCQIAEMLLSLPVLI